MGHCTGVKRGHYSYDPFSKIFLSSCFGNKRSPCNVLDICSIRTSFGDNDIETVFSLLRPSTFDRDNIGRIQLSIPCCFFCYGLADWNLWLNRQRWEHPTSDGPARLGGPPRISSRYGANPLCLASPLYWQSRAEACVVYQIQCSRKMVRYPARQIRIPRKIFQKNRQRLHSA